MITRYCDKQRAIISTDAGLVQTFYTKFVGLSTDTKPEAANGDEFYEMDTKKTLMYDADGETWQEE